MIPCGTESGRYIHGYLAGFAHTRRDQLSSTSVHMLHNEINGFSISLRDRYRHYGFGLLVEYVLHQGGYILFHFYFGCM